LGGRARPRGVDGQLGDGHVRGDDVGHAVRRAEDQRQNADGDEQSVPDGHPDSHPVPVSGELDDHRHDDAEQRETEGADESDERSDCGHGHGDRHCKTTIVRYYCCCC